MVNEKLREKISEEGYENSLVYDNPSFDTSIIGVDDNGKTVYLYQEMIEEYVADEFPELDYNDVDAVQDAYESAVEWIDYNTIRATPYMGGLAPVIIDLNPEDEKWYNLINGEEYDIETINFTIDGVEIDKDALTKYLMDIMNKETNIE